MRQHLIVGDDGEPFINGVQYQSTPEFWHSLPQWDSLIKLDHEQLKLKAKEGRKPIIVFKVPGGTSWYSRGEQKYYGAEFIVIEIDDIFERDGRIHLYGNDLIDFPIRKAK